MQDPTGSIQATAIMVNQVKPKHNQIAYQSGNENWLVRMAPRVCRPGDIRIAGTTVSTIIRYWNVPADRVAHHLVNGVYYIGMAWLLHLARFVTGVPGLRVPRSECSPICKLSIRIIRAPYRFIP